MDSFTEIEEEEQEEERDDDVSSFNSSWGKESEKSMDVPMLYSFSEEEESESGESSSDDYESDDEMLEKEFHSIQMCTANDREIFGDDVSSLLLFSWKIEQLAKEVAKSATIVVRGYRNINNVDWMLRNGYAAMLCSRVLRGDGPRLHYSHSSPSLLVEDIPYHVLTRLPQMGHLYLMLCSVDRCARRHDLDTLRHLVEVWHAPVTEKTILGAMREGLVDNFRYLMTRNIPFPSPIDMYACLINIVVVPEGIHQGHVDIVMYLLESLSNHRFTSLFYEPFKLALDLGSLPLYNAMQERRLFRFKDDIFLSSIANFHCTSPTQITLICDIIRQHSPQPSELEILFLLLEEHLDIIIVEFKGLSAYSSALSRAAGVSEGRLFAEYGLDRETRSTSAVRLRQIVGRLTPNMTEAKQKILMAIELNHALCVLCNDVSLARHRHKMVKRLIPFNDDHLIPYIVKQGAFHYLLVHGLNITQLITAYDRNTCLAFNNPNTILVSYATSLHTLEFIHAACNQQPFTNPQFDAIVQSGSLAMVEYAYAHLAEPPTDIMVEKVLSTNRFDVLNFLLSVAPGCVKARGPYVTIQSLETAQLIYKMSPDLLAKALFKSRSDADIDIIKYIYSVNAFNGDKVENEMIHSCRKGYLEIVKFIDSIHPNRFTRLPVDEAFLYEQHHVVDYLLANRTQEQFGCRAWTAAGHIGDIGVFEMIRTNTHINHLNSLYTNALGAACLYGNLALTLHVGASPEPVLMY
eukprot:gene7503-8779_t